MHLQLHYNSQVITFGAVHIVAACVCTYEICMHEYCIFVILQLYGKIATLGNLSYRKLHFAMYVHVVIFT